LFEKIATTAYKTSVDIAIEKGSFPFLKSIDDFLNTGYIKTLPKETRDYIKKAGVIRNSHLLTIAPTGSTGTMVGVSTGLEPYFAFKYFRSGRLGKFMEVEQNIVQEYRKFNKLKDTDKLPSIFVSSMELSPEEHVDVQTTIQR
jgi:ribonucleoside-diphosphate reductase alpha chain